MRENDKEKITFLGVGIAGKNSSPSLLKLSSYCQSSKRVGLVTFKLEVPSRCAVVGTKLPSLKASPASPSFYTI
jgi:hypothetical protein